MVTMNVTLPDGKSQELTAHESRVATVKLADGTEYGFRPTILDSSPWNRIVITIFKMPTSTESTKVVGETEVKRGAAAVASKTTPAFKLAVPNVTAPTHGGTAQTS
jgi:hypothetical protein